jgi:hypothetical protein
LVGLNFEQKMASSAAAEGSRKAAVPRLSKMARTSKPRTDDLSSNETNKAKLGKENITSSSPRVQSQSDVKQYMHKVNL